MIRTACLLCAFALASPVLHAADAAAPVHDAHATVQAAFAPWDNVEDLIAATIGGARKQVLVQAYVLTSRKIAAALIAARRREIDVRLLVDAQQLASTASPAVAEMAAAGIPVWVETRYQNAHNKIVVVDSHLPDAAVITGSYNFTWAAQHRNAENVLIVCGNPALASRYASNWERHRQDAMPYAKWADVADGK